MNASSWIMGLVGPAAKRVLIALGFGVVTYVGLDLTISAALNSARTAYGGMGAVPAAFLAMTGINTAFGIIMGGIVTRIAFAQVKRLVPQ